ncbi:unnamed protein product [Linum trigynum]|uniref:Uncharacterized protein n=1 Tax=Linum trigynum TaxID=586398 RepID=A0AAV2F808_9ROSI
MPLESGHQVAVAVVMVRVSETPSTARWSESLRWRWRWAMLSVSREREAAGGMKTEERLGQLSTLQTTENRGHGLVGLGKWAERLGQL